MVERKRFQSGGQRIFIRKKKLKFVKRSITRSQFHALIEKAAQPYKEGKTTQI